MWSLARPPKMVLAERSRDHLLSRLPRLLRIIDSVPYFKKFVFDSQAFEDRCIHLPGSRVGDITQNIVQKHDMVSLKSQGDFLQEGALAWTGNAETGVRLEQGAMRRANQV
jgi:hypothetical protein